MSSEKGNTAGEQYRHMATEEIERRLATEPLTQDEIVMASDELLQRKSRCVVNKESNIGAPKPPFMKASSLFGGILAAVTLYLIMPDYVHRIINNYLSLVILAAISIAAFVIGKMFPKISFLLGWAFMASPVAFILLARSEGLFAEHFWSVAILGYIALFIVSAFALLIGGYLLLGSKNSTEALDGIQDGLLAQGRKVFKNLFGW